MAVLSLEKARELLLTGLQPAGQVTIKLAAAAGRILAVPVVARQPFPPFPRSLVDGYALGPPPAGETTVDPGGGNPAAGRQCGRGNSGRAGGPAGSTGLTAATEFGGGVGAGLVYRLVGTVAAGSYTDITLAPGTAAAIFTGARPPAGTVAVIPREMAACRGEWLQVGEANLIEEDRGAARAAGLDSGVAWNGRLLPGEDAHAAPAQHQHILPASIFRVKTAAAGAAALPSGGRYLEPAGAEVNAGEEVLTPGTPLGPAEIGLLAALGTRQVAVYRRPQVALFTSGNELLSLEGGGELTASFPPTTGRPLCGLQLVAGKGLSAGFPATGRPGPDRPDNPGAATAGPAQPFPPGGSSTGPGAGMTGIGSGTAGLPALDPVAGHVTPGIYNSNSYALGTAIMAAGGRVIHAEILADNLEAQVAALQAALEQADVILTTGGAGGGAFDFTAAAFARTGAAILFTELAMRPGRRVIAARRGAKLMLGLPGTPPAALAVFYLLAAPVIRILAGREAGLVTLTARLAQAIERRRPERTFIWARVQDGSRGREVTPLPRRPGGIRAAAGANALIDLPPGAAPATGEEVRIVMLN